MIRRNGRIILLLALLSSLTWAACKESVTPTCQEPTTASLFIHCYHYAVDTSTVPTDTVLPYAHFVSLGVPVRNSQYTAGSSIFAISLSPFADSCKWGIIADSTKLVAGIELLDTLTFHYQRQLNFLSNACGYTYFYTLDTVNTTNHNIDSVIITNTGVTLNANGISQLAVYFHRDF